MLGSFRHQRNRAILHTDARVLPLRKSAWAAWNYEAARDASGEDAAACVHGVVNRLQQLPFDVPVIVSLNPVQEPAAVRRSTCAPRSPHASSAASPSCGRR